MLKSKRRLEKPRKPRKELEAMLVSAHKFGYRFFEYEARFFLAEIELQSHSPAAGPHLAALEKEAKDHGLLLISNRAQALATGK